jgi:hypothetical protein
MRTYKLLTLSLLLASPFTVACGGDKGESDTDTATSPTTSATATDGSSGGTTGEATTTPTTTEPGTTTTATDSTTGAPEDPFVFDETPPENLKQIDRMGMPAVATAVISKDNKDAYNAATPTEDAASTFVPDILMNVVGLHAALDDDLKGLGLTACDPMTSCVAQGAPLIVPDTIKIDTSMPSGFPNGRRLENPVIDVTLAVVLLDLSVHAPDTFANLPLNPPANDKEFLPDFPYLATPH